jgi:hypothetical protein
MKVGSTAGVISGLLPGAKKAGEDLYTTYVPDGTTDIVIIYKVLAAAFQYKPLSQSSQVHDISIGFVFI